MIARLGRWFLRELGELAYASGLVFTVLKESALFFRRRQVAFRVFVLQVLFTAVEATGIVAFVALALGALIIIQGNSLLPRFGQGKLLYTLLAIVITRELGPLLTAFIVTARSGTAIATELGNMVISHEIEAYVSVGINPIAYLVVPRFLGVTVSMVLLNVYFNFFGLFGSFLLSQLVQPIPFAEYVGNLLAALSPADFGSSLVKSVVFGMIISLVAAYQGFRVKVSSTEVPQIAIKAVGQGFVLCILADAVITLIYYL
jgi:phospholipid/cholesterol/gamma-HCH transport system permease protein